MPIPGMIADIQMESSLQNAHWAGEIVFVIIMAMSIATLREVSTMVHEEVLSG